MLFFSVSVSIASISVCFTRVPYFLLFYFRSVMFWTKTKLYLKYFNRRETVCMCVEAYQELMQSTLYAIPTRFMHYLAISPLAKGQQFLCHITQPIEH